MLVAPAAIAQSLQSDLYVANGAVNAMAVSGNTLYIGGSFTSVGPPTGSGAALDVASGTPNLALPKILGKVYAVTADGFGGWFIGGDFSHVGGVSRRNLAHIRWDNVVTAFDPSPNGQVTALAINGNTLYAGGNPAPTGIPRLF